MYHVIPEEEKNSPESMDGLSDTTSMSSFDMCEMDEGLSETCAADGSPQAEQAQECQMTGVHEVSMDLACMPACDLVNTGTAAEAESDPTQGVPLATHMAEHAVSFSLEESSATEGAASVGVLTSDADGHPPLQACTTNNALTGANETPQDPCIVETNRASQSDEVRFITEPETGAHAPGDSDSVETNGRDVLALTTGTDGETVDSIVLLPASASIPGKPVNHEQDAALSAREEKKLAEDLIRLAHAVSQREGVRQAVRQEVEASSDLRSSLQLLLGGAMQGQELPAQPQPPASDAVGPSGQLLDTPSPTREDAASQRGLSHPHQRDEPQAEPAQTEARAQEGSQEPLLAGSAAQALEDPEDAAFVSSGQMDAQASAPAAATDAVVFGAAAERFGIDRRHPARPDVPPIVRKVNQGLRSAWQGAREALRRAKDHFDGLHNDCEGSRERGGYTGGYTHRGRGAGREQCLDTSNVILTTAVVAAAGLLVHSVISSSSSSRSRRE